MTVQKYFSLDMTIEELRKKFHSLCLEFHPDKGGNPADFREMKDEYDNIIRLFSASEAGKANAENRKARYTYESEKELQEALEKLLNIPGIVVEICGCWLWITGNTYPVHTRISSIGAKYSKQKKSWYWAAVMSRGKIRGRYNSLKKIREAFGSIRIESEAEETVLLTA